MPVVRNKRPINAADLPPDNAMDSEVTAVVAAHAGHTDPHPIYLTQAEGDGRYRRSTTTSFFQGGVQELAPYASCISSGTSMAAAYSNTQASNFTFGLHIQSFPWASAAYLAFHRPGYLLAFLGIDSDNQLKWGGGNALPPYRIWHEQYGVPVWQAPSDPKLKKNVRPIKSALTMILEAKPISFQYRSTVGQWSDSEYQRKKIHYGFNAEEFPISDLVSMKENNYLGLDYLEIIPFLVCAIQELHAQLQQQNTSADVS